MEGAERNNDNYYIFLDTTKPQTNPILYPMPHAIIYRKYKKKPGLKLQMEKKDHYADRSVSQWLSRPSLDV